jgi:hypothetical protein
MPQNFTTLVSEVAEVVRGVSGITAAPATPSENIGRGIFALTYLMTSTTELSETGTLQHLATVASDILTPRTDLDRDIARLLPVVDLVDVALLTEFVTIGAFFDAAADAGVYIRWDFIPSYPYSGIECVCYRAILDEITQKIDLP